MLLAPGENYVEKVIFIQPFSLRFYYKYVKYLNLILSQVYLQIMKAMEFPLRPEELLNMSIYCPILCIYDHDLLGM